jgi:hypothetical protein
MIRGNGQLILMAEFPGETCIDRAFMCRPVLQGQSCRRSQQRLRNHHRHRRAQRRRREASCPPIGRGIQRKNQAIIYFIEKDSTGNKTHIFADFDKEEVRYDSTDIPPGRILAKIKAEFKNSTSDIAYKES